VAVYASFVLRVQAAVKVAGYRVIHVFSPQDGTPVILITVFAKNEKANLSKAETETVKTLGKALTETYRSKR